MRFLRRRKFLVKKKLQLSLLVTTLFYLALFVLVVGVALFLPPFLDLEGGGADSRKAMQAATQILYLHGHFWWPVLFTLVFIGLHSIRTSHRFAGALYRFEQVFENVAKGVVPGPVRLREKDYLQEEAQVINRMLEALRTRIHTLQEAQQDLRAAVAGWREVVDRGLRDEAMKRLEDLAAREEELRRRLDCFVVVPGDFGATREVSLPS